jgi:hypothetical protein
MKNSIRALLLAAGFAVAAQASSQVTFFEHDDYHGHRFTANGPVHNFADIGFNDAASSVLVRGGTWEVCTDAGFNGRCVALQPGDYPSLNELGLNDRISSVRPLSSYGRNDRGYRREYSGDQQRWDRSREDWQSRERERGDWEQNRDRNYDYRR